MPPHEETVSTSIEGPENLTRAEVLRVFGATDHELTAALNDGLPENPDGTFRFVAVLAWIECRLGTLHSAKMKR